MTDGTQAPAASEAPAAAETPAAAPANDSLPSAADIMAFDPFGPGSNDLPEDVVTPDGTPPKPSADAQGQTGSQTNGTPPLKAGEKPPAGTQPIDPNAPKPTPATTPQATQPQQPDLAALIAQQTQTIAEALKRPAQPAATPGQDQPTPPRYNLGLPPQIINALRSEDNAEFAGGMHAVINGIANRIWEDVSAHLQEYVQQTVPAMMQSHTQSRTTQEAVAADFYGKYPSLQNPVLKPTIQAIGAQIAQQRAQQGLPVEWNDQLRDAIAEAVFTALPQLRPAAAPASQPQVPASQQQPARTPFASGGGPRPAPAPATNEFTELLN